MRFIEESFELRRPSAYARWTGKGIEDLAPQPGTRALELVR